MKQAPEAVPSEERCMWAEDELYAYWETSCGKQFFLTDGTPRENGLRFCCYCGKKLRQRKAR